MKPEDLRSAVGGQAVLEGVMMRSPHAMAIAVRRPDGTVILKDEAYHSLAERYPVLKRAFLRGPVILVEAMVTGVKALTFSAQAALQEEDADKEDEPLGWGSIVLTLGGAFLMAFLFFGFLPHWLSGKAGYLLGSLNIYFPLPRGMGRVKRRHGRAARSHGGRHVQAGGERHAADPQCP